MQTLQDILGRPGICSQYMPGNPSVVTHQTSQHKPFESKPSSAECHHKDELLHGFSREIHHPQASLLIHAQWAGNPLGNRGNHVLNSLFRLLPPTALLNIILFLSLPQFAYPVQDVPPRTFFCEYPSPIYAMACLCFSPATIPSSIIFSNTSCSFKAMLIEKLNKQSETSNNYSFLKSRI